MLVRIFWKYISIWLTNSILDSLHQGKLVISNITVTNSTENSPSWSKEQTMASTGLMSGLVAHISPVYSHFVIAEIWSWSRQPWLFIKHTVHTCYYYKYKQIRQNTLKDPNWVLTPPHLALLCYGVVKWHGTVNHFWIKQELHFSALSVNIGQGLCHGFTLIRTTIRM